MTLFIVKEINYFIYCIGFLFNFVVFLVQLKFVHISAKFIKTSFRSYKIYRDFFISRPRHEIRVCNVYSRVFVVQRACAALVVR